MRESSFGSGFATELIKEYGGKCWKISDKVNLGLPDNLHFKDSICTFFETKIYDERGLKTLNGRICIEPSRAINDLRQFERCKSTGIHSLTCYVIYCPNLKMTAVIPMSALIAFIDTPKNKAVLRYLEQGDYFRPGNGVDTLINLMQIRRRAIYEELNGKYGSRIS